MRVFPWPRGRLSKNVQLLITLLSLFFAPSFLDDKGIGIQILALILLISIISIIREFYAHRKIFTLLLAVAVVGFILDVVGHIIAQNDTQQVGLDVISNFIYLCFYFMAILLLMRQIFAGDKVTKDTIVGGVSIYLLIGLFWFLLYREVVIIDNNAFSTVPPGPFKLVYFSFTTLTTLGYGDITPVSKMAMTLSNVEAIVGQLYPAIYIARLVGLYTAQESTSV